MDNKSKKTDEYATAKALGKTVHGDDVPFPKHIEKPLDQVETETENPNLEYTQEEKLLNDGPDSLTFDEKLNLFIDASEIKKNADFEKRNAQKTIDALQETLVDEFIEKEMTSIKKRNRTIYFHKQGWAKVMPADSEMKSPLPLDKLKAVKTLQSMGLDEYVTVGIQGLSSHLRELEKNGDPFPTELDGIIAFEKRASLRMRKS